MEVSTITTGGAFSAGRSGHAIPLIAAAFGVLSGGRRAPVVGGFLRGPPRGGGSHRPVQLRCIMRPCGLGRPTCWSLLKKNA